MAGWHHQLDGHEFEWTPGVGDGQGGLECCNSWGHKESDTTERLNWTKLILVSGLVISSQLVWIHGLARWPWLWLQFLSCWIFLSPFPSSLLYLSPGLSRTGVKVCGGLVFQLLSHVLPGFPALHHLLEFAQTHVCWVSDAIQPSNSLWPLLLLPSIFPTIRVFSSESALHIRWPNELHEQYEKAKKQKPIVHDIKRLIFLYLRKNLLIF